jgi:hypothetical protein
MTLTGGDSVDDFAEIIATHRSEQPLSPPFDPRRSFLPKTNVIWVVGRGKDGRVLHTQALRLLDLCGQTLGAYLSQRFVDFPPGGVDLDLERSWFQPGPGAAMITGRVAYHGEMWLADDPAYRGRGLIDLLARYAFMMAMLHWDPDHLFGFIKRPTARRGLAEREGYMHSDPYCLNWAVQGQEAQIACNMVWMAQRDLCHVMHVPLDPDHAG